MSRAEKSIIDVSSTMEEMSVAMEQTTTALSHIHSSVEEIHIHIDNITGKALEGNQFTDEIQNKAKIIYEEAEKMNSFMEKISLNGYRNLLSMSEEYFNDAKNIHGMMRNLANNSEQIKEFIDEIKLEVNEVNVAVEESTKGIFQISENSTELSHSMQDIKDKADLNSEITIQLEREVNKFKLA